MTFQVSTLSQKDFVMIQITDTHLLEYPHLEFVGMQPEQWSSPVLGSSNHASFVPLLVVKAGCAVDSVEAPPARHDSREG